jgi:peptidoglycan/xylan/chitin deacetylase (PgdA/CDA1 family)
VHEEIANSRAALEDTLGETIHFLRFPYGERCGLSARTIRQQFGLQTVHWTFSSHDSRARSEHEIMQRFTPRLRGGSIVLMHDCLADETQGLPTRYHADRTAMLASIPLIGRLLVERNLRSVTVGQLIATG